MAACAAAVPWRPGRPVLPARCRASRLCPLPFFRVELCLGAVSVAVLQTAQ